MDGEDQRQASCGGLHWRDWTKQGGGSESGGEGLASEVAGKPGGTKRREHFKEESMDDPAKRC